MDRVVFLNLARKHGFRDGSELGADGKRRPIAGTGLQAMREEVRAYFETPEGQAVLARASGWLRQKPLDEVIELLLSEVK